MICAKEYLKLCLFLTEGLMVLLRQIGTAYQKLASYECKQAIELFSSLPPHQYNTGWVLAQVGRAYFEIAEYQLVCMFILSTNRPH